MQRKTILARNRKITDRHSSVVVKFNNIARAMARVSAECQILRTKASDTSLTAREFAKEAKAHATFLKGEGAKVAELLADFQAEVVILDAVIEGVLEQQVKDACRRSG